MAKKKKKTYRDKSELGKAKRRVAKLGFAGRPIPATKLCRAMLGSEYGGQFSIAVASLSEERVLSSAGSCGDEAADAITRDQLSTLSRLVRTNRRLTAMSREAQTAMVFANSKMSPFVRLEPWRLRAIFYMAQEMSTGTGVANRAGLGIDLSALTRGTSDDHTFEIGSSCAMVQRMDDGPPFLIAGVSKTVARRPTATQPIDFVAVACVFDLAVVVRRRFTTDEGTFISMRGCDVASLAALGVCALTGRALPPGV